MIAALIKVIIIKTISLNSNFEEGGVLLFSSDKVVEGNKLMILVRVIATIIRINRCSLSFLHDDVP